MTDLPLTEDNTPDNEPGYYFTGGFNEDFQPALRIVKDWPEGRQALTVGAYESFDEAFAAERELTALRDTAGLQVAMREVERRAEAGDFLDPTRADGRLFTDGPPDPFTTRREGEIDGLSYTYDVVAQPSGTHELRSIKTWEDESGIGMQSIALGEYDRPGDARAEQELLQATGREDGMEAEMRAVERIAVENGSLLADRADPRLFTDGPSDPFITQRQEELDNGLGYYFRAGPALDGGEMADAYSLNLVNVEREGVDYRFSHSEFLRVAPADAAYVDDAAERFNDMLASEGTGPAVSAAAAWSRELGATPSLEWHDSSADLLDQRQIPDLDSPTMRLPPVKPSPELDI